jgi:hypothetical protein
MSAWNYVRQYARATAEPTAFMGIVLASSLLSFSFSEADESVHKTAVRLIKQDASCKAEYRESVVAIEKAAYSKLKDILRDDAGKTQHPLVKSMSKKDQISKSDINDLVRKMYPQLQDEEDLIFEFDPNNKDKADKAKNVSEVVEEYRCIPSSMMEGKVLSVVNVNPSVLYTDTYKKMSSVIINCVEQKKELYSIFSKVSFQIGREMEAVGTEMTSERETAIDSLIRMAIQGLGLYGVISVLRKTIADYPQKILPYLKRRAGFYGNIGAPFIIILGHLIAVNALEGVFELTDDTPSEERKKAARSHALLKRIREWSLYDIDSVYARGW